MAARGFCQHGKVWTTCPICGKDVIAAAAKRGGGSDEFMPPMRPKKKPVAAAPEDEAPEPAEAPEEPTED